MYSSCGRELGHKPPDSPESHTTCCVDQPRCHCICILRRARCVFLSDCLRSPGDKSLRAERSNLCLKRDCFVAYAPRNDTRNPLWDSLSALVTHYSSLLSLPPAHRKNRLRRP